MKTLFQSGGKLKIKICGLVLKGDIDICEEFGVDALGFLVKAEKPSTNIDILLEEEAKELISKVPKKVKSVLLIKFSNIDYIVNLIKNTKPDVVQLQKEVDRIEIAKELRVLFPYIEIIRTFHFDNESSIDFLYNQIDEYSLYIDAVNIDSKEGGSGKRHNWDISSKICEYVKSRGLAFILAGGINAENIEEAFYKVRPDMIDIMSGARSDNRLDKKDPMKIEQIMNIANKININYEI